MKTNGNICGTTATTSKLKALMRIMVGLLVLFMVGTVRANTGSQVCGEDTVVSENFPANNYGSATTMGVAGETSHRTKCLLKFDVSWIPAGSTINSVTLSLYCFTHPGGDTPQLLCSADSAWYENTATWNNQPSAAEYQCSKIFSSTGWQSWDTSADSNLTPLKNVVQAWVNGTKSNWGFLLVDTVNNSSNYGFYTREYSSGSYATMLWVDYTPPVNHAPNAPSIVSPTEGTTGVSLTPTLQAGPFSDPDVGDTHASSWWVMNRDSTGAKIYESGEVAASTSRTIPAGVLAYSTQYSWRVRYKDNHGNWSEFSTENGTHFTTLDSCMTLSTPTPTSSSCGSTVSTTTPTLHWGDVAHDSGYVVSIYSGDSCSGSPIHTSSQLAANTTSYAVPSGVLARGQTYSWTVVAKGNGSTYCDSNPSSCCSFSVTCATVSSPVPSSPSCSSTVSSTTPTLQWGDVANEDGYVVQVFNGGSCSGTPIHTSSQLAANTTSHAVPSGVLASGQTYSWQVQAKGNGTSYCDGGWSSCCSFTVMQTNTPPTVNAGSDLVVTLPAIASLSGTASDDGIPSGILNPTWSKVSGPGTVSFGSPNSLSTMATFSTNGTYVLRLTVSDGALSSHDDVQVVANARPHIVTPPATTNTLTQVGGLPVVAASAPICFTANADDADRNPLSCLWNFGDGGTSTDCDPCHVFTDCGPHAVSVEVNDGIASTAATSTVSVACSLTITKMQTKLNFAKPYSDSCTLTATLDLGAGFGQAGGQRQVTLDIGDATLSFTLDAKGRGVNSNGSCKLAYNNRTGWTLTVTLAKGSWRTQWATYGLTNETVKNKLVTTPVVVVIDTEAFAVERTMLYTAKYGQSGTAK
jgi:hypothetical protein